jgi:hypothetical protein
MKMRKTLVFGAVLLLVALAACKGGEKAVSEGAPFIGGTTGVTISFIDFRSDVFDSGDDPFDVTVKLENVGEWAVPQEEMRVSLSGINPAEFGKHVEDFVAKPTEDLIETRKDSAGNVIKSPPITVEFNNLNYQDSLAGASLEFPLVASVCYGYGTDVQSKLCVRKSILNPEEGGLCEIIADKTAYNSAAPVQVENLKESARAGDKIGFSFDIAQAGTGKIFEDGSGCLNENKVKVKIDARLSGLSCTGLVTTGTAAEGTTTLFDGKKTVSCTQQIGRTDDYEQKLSITLGYEYEESAQTTLNVKRSE